MIYWIYNFMILAFFIKTIQLSFNLSGTAFIFQFFGIILLLLLATPVAFAKKNGTFFFSLALLDALFIYMVYGKNFTVVLIPISASIIGYVASFIHVKEFEPPEDTYVYEEPPETKVILENYDEKDNPKQYVASKYGKVYHTTNCGWGKKIKKKSQIWLKDKKEAKKKGFKAHNCV